MSILKHWPIVSKVIDVVAYTVATAAMLICMFKHEWVEGIFWGVFICSLKLQEIKEALDDRL